MYKHVLVPTDGTSLSRKNIKAAMQLAKALGAKVTGVHVLAPYYQPPAFADGAVYIPGFSAEDYRRYGEKQARKALGAIERAARAARVRCATRIVTAPQAAYGILKTARAARCDLIAMASRRRGLNALLGSETRRVLAEAKVPVIVLP